MLCRTCFEAGQSNASFLHTSAFNSTLFAIRWVSGASRRKPRIARIKQLKTPTMLALDHFDFYYGPLFGKRWPSVRLGLLSPNKFVAVVNRFSKDYEMNERILRDLGTLNLIEHITAGRAQPPSHVERKRKKFEEIVAKTQQEANAAVSETVSLDDKKNRRELGGDDDFDDGENVDALRSEAESMGIFREDKATFQLHELKKRDKPKSKRVILDSEFQITGLEGMGRNVLGVAKDVLAYPRNLNLQVFDRAVLGDFPAPIRDSYGISSWWLLDGGSVLPVLALDLQPKDVVLDMCAAPGGKSLMIAQTQNFSCLTCNDEKLTRLGQLRRGLAMYLPDTCPEASKIIIKRKDASSVESWDEFDVYDKVLLDAPCSTDRLSATQDENNLFMTVNTTQRLDLPILQTRLLINALRSVRVGGSVVYSTCTLAPTQNECVVENASVLADQYYGIRCVEQSLQDLRTHTQTSGLYSYSKIGRHGLLVLPTVLSNFGPMYVCKLKRLT